jgi:hypothetical protein
MAGLGGMLGYVAMYGYGHTDAGSRWWTLDFIGFLL